MQDMHRTCRTCAYICNNICPEERKATSVDTSSALTACSLQKILRVARRVYDHPRCVRMQVCGREAFTAPAVVTWRVKIERTSVHNNTAVGVWAGCGDFVSDPLWCYLSNFFAVARACHAHS